MDFVRISILRSVYRGNIKILLLQNVFSVPIKKDMLKKLMKNAFLKFANTSPYDVTSPPSTKELHVWIHICLHPILWLNYTPSPGILPVAKMPSWRKGPARRRKKLTDSKLERDMLRFDLDGLVVLAGFPELRVGDDPEDVEGVDDVVGRAAHPGGRGWRVVALLQLMHRNIIYIGPYGSLYTFWLQK